MNGSGGINFSGVYGLYELDGTLNGNAFRLATVDFEKGLNNTPVETIWIKGDFDLDGKLSNADLQTMLTALPESKSSGQRLADVGISGIAQHVERRIPCHMRHQR